MAPTVDVDSSNLKRGNGDGISLTKTEYHGGKHPYVKFSWSYHDKSPEKFIVIIVKVDDKKKWYEDGKYWTKKYGNYKGWGEVHLDDLHVKHGKYTLRLVNIHNYKDVYAESKPFYVE